MMKHIILPLQTLLDIAIQHHGTPDAVFDIIKANDENLCETPVVGKELEITDSAQKNKNIALYYNIKNIQPATGLTGSVNQTAGFTIGFSLGFNS